MSLSLNPGDGERPLHPRAFAVTVFWTLALLFLGSIVHATESSLACPDWPTCFGSMVPEMTGGVFWEHLHRLVAGGLVLMFGLATWLARREATDRPWMFRTGMAGLGLLLVQSVFGGITVIYELPSLVSTTHLALAFAFVALATVLTSSTAWRPRTRAANPEVARRLRNLAGASAGLVFAQSVTGGLVRHLDAGMSCPDAPLCLGQVVPPLVNPLITVHFGHRVLGFLTAAAVVALAVWASRVDLPPRLRRWTTFAAWLVVAQVLLGFASVLTVLAVVPVSFHTLVAATLIVVLVHVATSGAALAARLPTAMAGHGLE
ncbi:MAG: COX15/CtaA family protein [Gemmatimonadota bacterium]|nr:COX15/CtaA family protein [Gemmatimonadota bacterium]